MARIVVSVDPLDVGASVIGRDAIATVADVVTAGRISDFLQVGPDEWSEVQTRYPHLTMPLPFGRTGCVLWLGGRIVILTSVDHLVIEVEGHECDGGRTP